MNTHLTKNPVPMVKQSSSGLLLRCIQCHTYFKMSNYYQKNNTTYTKFECNCGRTIKIKEPNHNTTNNVHPKTNPPTTILTN